MNRLGWCAFLLLFSLVSVLTACDPNNTKADQAPTLEKPGNQRSRVGDTVTLKIKATDPQNDKLNFFASGLPNGLSMDAVGVISGSPTQEESALVTVRVDDGNGNRRQAIFGWVVTAAEPSELSAGSSGTD